MVDPNLKLELILKPGTIFQGNGGVEKWVSPISGHCFTQDTVASKPQLQSDGLYFDGGDMMAMPFPDVLRGATFTIEFWIKLATSSDSCFMSQENLGSVWFVRRQASEIRMFATASGGIVATISWPATSVWFHIAICINPNKVFLNGISQTLTTNTGFDALTGTGRLYLAADYDATGRPNATFTDIRIYNSAKYTANFTPPPRSQLAMPSPTLPPLAAISAALSSNQFQFGG